MCGYFKIGLRKEREREEGLEECSVTLIVIQSLGGMKCTVAHSQKTLCSAAGILFVLIVKSCRAAGLRHFLTHVQSLQVDLVLFVL